MCATKQQVLTELVRVDVPAPRLIAADPSGRVAGVPAILMTRLPGQIHLRPSEPERWLRELAPHWRDSLGRLRPSPEASVPQAIFEGTTVGVWSPGRSSATIAQLTANARTPPWHA